MTFNKTQIKNPDDFFTDLCVLFPSAIIFTVNADQQITNCSLAVEQILGHSAGELTGNDCFAVFGKLLTDSADGEKITLADKQGQLIALTQFARAILMIHIIFRVPFMYCFRKMKQRPPKALPPWPARNNFMAFSVPIQPCIRFSVL